MSTQRHHAPRLGDGADSILVHLLRTWAVQHLRIVRGGKRYPDGSWHVDGWPSISVSGRIQKQGEGASQVQQKQNFVEVFSEEALLIRRAMDGMRYEMRTVIEWYYVDRVPVRTAAKILAIDRHSYRELFAGAHHYLQGRIDQITTESGRPLAEA